MKCPPLNLKHLPLVHLAGHDSFLVEKTEKMAFKGSLHRSLVSPCLPPMMCTSSASLLRPALSRSALLKPPSPFWLFKGVSEELLLSTGPSARVLSEDYIFLVTASPPCPTSSWVIIYTKKASHFMCTFPRIDRVSTVGIFHELC